MDAGNKPPLPRFSLKRWSQRKLEAAREDAPAPAAPDVAASMPAPPEASPLSVAVDDQVIPPSSAQQVPELPPVETLTFESDFTAFLQPRVEEAVKRQALKKLFQDPRFNVMDGLDTYIDDYSIPSPVSPELLREMVHARFTLDPPRTRINAAGYVEDVPPKEIEAGTPGEEVATQTPRDAASGADGAAASSSSDEPVLQPLDANGTASTAQRIESAPNGNAASAAQPQRNDDR